MVLNHSQAFKDCSEREKRAPRGDTFRNDQPSRRPENASHGDNAVRYWKIPTRAHANRLKNTPENSIVTNTS